MKPTVLFLCTGNSARSQMAEGWLRHLAGDRFEVHSAGTHPAGLHPRSVEVMAEIGADIGGQWSKGLDQVAGLQFDYVITVCDRAQETCPRWPAQIALIHWSFEDPAAISEAVAQREAFCRVRDEIGTAVRALLGALPPGPSQI